MIRQMLAVYALILLAVFYMMVGEFWLGVVIIFSAASVSSI